MDEAELELGLCVHGNEQSPILEGWFTGTMEKPFSHPLEARSLCFRSTDCDLLVLPEFQGARCRSLEPFCTLCGYFKHTLSLATRCCTTLSKGGGSSSLWDRVWASSDQDPASWKHVLWLPCGRMVSWCSWLPDSILILRWRRSIPSYTFKASCSGHTALSVLIPGSCRLSPQPRLGRPLPCAPLKCILLVPGYCWVLTLRVAPYL